MKSTCQNFWRAAQFNASALIAYTEPICKIVADAADVILWNLDWVADEYKKDFPLKSICTDWIRDSFTPEIDIDEISLFDY